MQPKLCGKFKFPMKLIADWALDVANHLGTSYADVRLADDRQRALSTKNGKVGNASEAESFGFGVRVMADGAWGFAATEDLTRRRGSHCRPGR